MGLIFDVETNDPGDFRTLEALERVFCLAVADEEAGEPELYFDAPMEGRVAAGRIADGIVRLIHADRVIGHNVIGFDLPVFRRLYGGLHFTETLVEDTMVHSAVAYPDLYVWDEKRRAVPQHLAGSHGLEAWGYRLGERKDASYKAREEAWTALTPEMLDYCAQDVRVTRKLWHLLRKMSARWPRAVELERPFAACLQDQMALGARFDSARAETVTGELEGRRLAMEERIAASVPPFVDLHVSPVKKVERWVTTPFNPRSAAHKVRHFTERRSWKPAPGKAGHTETGRVKMDDTVLPRLAELYPEAAIMAEHAELTKIMGYLADGDRAWTKLVKPTGRIHGEIRHNGTVTSRCSHSRPNLGNVPKTGELGHLCRSLFVASERWVLVGCDASGLELRMLAHHLTEWDGGEYGRLIDHGDVHQHTADVLGVDRELAKRVMYATLYGAGDSKLGRVLGRSKSEGAAVRARLLDGIRGLRPLTKRCKESSCLTGLDGRRLPVRSEHGALNTQLQGDGAIVMKQAVVNMNRALASPTWRQVLFVHDEVQAEVHPDCAQRAGEVMADCIVRAGVGLGVRVPLKGAFKIGNTWAETH